MQILDSADQLPVKLGCLLLIQACISDDEVEKLTSVRMLHDHEKFLLGLNYFVELDDIGVANLFKNFNLPRDPLNVLLVVDLFFF